jgi:hypothetical protein
MRVTSCVLFLWLLVFAGPAPAKAAPPVERPRGTHGNVGFAPAASALGVDEWGDSDRFNHLMLSATRDTATLWIVLPEDTPEEAAATCLQSVSDGLRWRSPRLSLYPRTGGMILKADGALRPASLSPERSRLTLELPRIARIVRRTVPKPILLAVRTPGVTALDPSPRPSVSGTRRGDGFLFYRLPQSGLRPLQLDYGVPPRWPLAAGLGLLLWLLFPLLPALAVCRYATAGQPEARLRLFDRCDVAIRVISTAGFFVTVTALHLERTRYFGFNPWFGLPPGFSLLLPYWYWCGGLIGLLRRRLARLLAPQGLMVRGNPLLAFSSAVVMLAIVIGPGLLLAQFGPRTAMRGFPVFTGAALALMGCVLLALFGPRLLKKPQPLLNLRFDSLPEDPDALKELLRVRMDEAVREREALAVPPKLTPVQAKAVAASPVAQAVLALDPRQQVALGAAYHLVEPRFLRLHRLQCAAFFGPVLLEIAAGLWSCLHPLPGVAGVLVPAASALLLGAGQPLVLAIGRRITRDCQAADLRIARALDDPRLYLDLLLRLEQAERELDAVTGVKQARAQGFRARRCALEQALGIGE